MTIQQERRKAGLAGILLLVTTVAVLLQAIGLEKTMVIDASTELQYNALDDRPLGGASVSSIDIVDNKIILNCEIIPSDYQWPFCNVSFKMAEGANGVDLSSYKYFRIWIHYKDHQDSAIRFQARHFDAEYSRYEDESSLKYNTIEFYDKSNTHPLIVRYDQFQVPTWWLVWKQLSHEYGAPDFSNVFSLMVGTGHSIDPGDRTIVIERIELVGDVISGQDLYLVLLALWGSIGLFYFLDKVFFVQRHNSDKAKQRAEVAALTKLLEGKSEELSHTLARNRETGALDSDSIIDLFKDVARSETSPNLSMMFVGVDSFETLCEQKGEDYGQRVLAITSQILFQNIRSSDIVARWGKKEFVLICPHTELTYASQLAEKLRCMLEETDWPEGMPVTASFGVAECLDESPTDFIGRATKALHAAKAQGRNRVVTATAHMVEFTHDESPA